MIKTGFPSFFMPSTPCTVVKTESRFAVVKMDSPSFYKPPTCFEDGLSKPPTCFSMVKMDSESFYKLPTPVPVFKTDSPRI